MATPCRDEDDELHGGSNGGTHGHGHSHGSHGHSHDHSHEPLDGSGDSLYPFIDKDKVHCLNEARQGMGKDIVKSWAHRLDAEPRLESDVDAELLLTIPFTSAVHLKSFCIVAGEKDKGPSKVKLFVNRDDIDFDSARDLEPAQELDLIEDFNASIDFPVRPKKFKSVSSLTLFFPENFTGDEDEKTIMSYIGFKGEGTDLKRGVVDTVYEASAQLKDHTKVEGTSNAQSYLS